MVLARDGLPQVLHGDRAVRRGGQERGVHRRVRDVAAGQPELPAQLPDVDVRAAPGGQADLPDPGPLAFAGEWEADDELEPPGKGLVLVLVSLQ